MTPIRYAIWAAVSTDAQAADDKYSLVEQEARCRSTATDKGWLEAAAPYIVRGESRTRWVNLSDAEQAIPELKTLLDDARDGKFDVVVCHEFDRFRELLDPVARTLSHYGVQLYSVSQPLEPQRPGDYSPYTNDSEFILRGMNQMISRASVANLRRKYFANMPKRVTEKGLSAASLPWGYKKPEGHETDPSVVPVQIPELVQYLILMKDMLLAGRSTYQITAELDRLGAPIPKARLRKKTKRTLWDATTVTRLLRNPYYAGYVRWGVTKTKHDIRTGKITRENQPAHQVIMARGAHEPLWDDETHQAILAELERRTPSHRGHITRQLTGLLHCSICGAMLWRHTRHNHHKENTPYYITWRCSEAFAAHMVVLDDDMLKAVAKELENQILHQGDSPVEAKSYTDELEQLRQKRSRIGDAFTNGLFDLAEFSHRVEDIDSRIKELENNQKISDSRQATSLMRKKALDNLREVMSQVDLDEYFRTCDRQEVNAALHYIFSEIIVNPNGEIVKVIAKQ
jgi:hypothetical protein